MITKLFRNEQTAKSSLKFVAIMTPVFVIPALLLGLTTHVLASPTSYPVTPPNPSPTKPVTPPNPSTTPKPPKPTPPPKPTIIPWPTKTPKPTPTPKPNTAPVIMRTSLGTGKRGVWFLRTIRAVDFDRDPITIKAANLPPGLSLSVCSTMVFPDRRQKDCYISGKPTKAGVYNVTITAQDTFGHISTAQFPLTIKK